MAHDHHHCECKHTRIKFCARCKVPHCLDCHMEWVTKPVYHGYWYNGTGYYSNGVYNTGTVTLDNVSGTVTTGSAGYTTESLPASTFTACDHGGN